MMLKERYGLEQSDKSIDKHHNDGTSEDEGTKHKEKKHHEHKIARAMKSVRWLIFWVSLAMIFMVGVYFFYGHQKAMEFLGGYLIELSLSIDNVFVFLMIFLSFGIEEHAQHRVLGWGIMGAIVLRFIFIFFGVAAVDKFEWVLYIFGVILIISAFRMVKNEEKKDPHDSKVIKVLHRFVPVTDHFVGEKFFVIENGKRMATPLFAVLILIESSDIMFAIDSVPAVLSVSTDLFIVYTSNIFAILGLRQLFFVIEHVQERFRYVKYGVAVILAFTGVKMLLGMFSYHIAVEASIIFIVTVLAASVILSVIISKRKEGNGA